MPYIIQDIPFKGSLCVTKLIVDLVKFVDLPI